VKSPSKTPPEYDVDSMLISQSYLVCFNVSIMWVLRVYSEAIFAEFCLIPAQPFQASVRSSVAVHHQIRIVFSNLSSSTMY